MADLKTVYRILRKIAVEHKRCFYLELSNHYAAEPNGYWIHPHHGWIEPLQPLNEHLHEWNNKCPALSAVVQVEGAEEPGSGFWKVPNAPLCPATKPERIATYNGFLQIVYNFAWPERLP